MAWLAQNWIWLLFGVAFVAMHLFGHGCHGGHGGHGSHNSGRGDASEDAQPATPPTSGRPHQH